MDIICSLQNTKTFCRMVQEAAQANIEFALRLGTNRPYTVFAPTDEAFAENEERFAKLKAHEKNRTVFFHFNEDVILTLDDLECQSKVTSLTGDMSRVKCRRKSPGVYVKFQRGRGNNELEDYPLIDIKSKVACSGIIHRLDKVMLPILFKPYKDLVPPKYATPDPEVTVFPTESPTVEVTTLEPTPSPTDQDTREPTPFPTEAEVTPEPTPFPTDAEVTPEPTEDNIIIIPIASPSKDDGSEKEPTPSPTLIVVDPNPNPAPVRAPTLAPTEGEVSTPTEPSIATTAPTILVTEPEKKRFRINALGINLIMFSTLLLCFVFVCMRR